ncbi:MAG: GIY-YIG nuclease family protein [Candidatus Thiodiazotropha lotti]|uniref:GIY-YIG nuclease family protein n=1 Tax=Candidatus Thiodiazotropha lotti TaxID=2792787 RepID=A0A9E4N0L2_9GAMM|nr:GIY-YIG nuclease family protein [Candidatus Thiodiazotropha lotti]MCW4203372.1 GIY-YIG nuclease family protein [Candidatus Thiodiazotropha lotti]
MAEKSNKELLDELGVEVKKEKKAKLTPKEERVIAGFEEIQRFTDEHGNPPEHGEEKDIFERLYAVRLDRIASQAEYRDLVSDLDHQALLSVERKIAEPTGEYESDADILAELGVEAPKEGDVTFLRHVKPRAESKTAEEIATRSPCENFEDFEPLFKKVKTELEQGLRKSSRFGRDASIEKGNFFIVGGLMAYVAEVGELRKAPNGSEDARLRVIYSNGTESNLLLWSLQRALYKDDAGRRISGKDYGPLFDDEIEADDLASGTIYVLRSMSDHPAIAQNRDVIHKIGVTGGNVKKRLASAKYDPTYLMADVEVVATYELYNINRGKLEHLLHRFFESSKLEIEIADRFGKPVVPQEWFLVPLFIIDEVVKKVVDGTISSYKYDFKSAKLVDSSEK